MELSYEEIAARGEAAKQALAKLNLQTCSVAPLEFKDGRQMLRFKISPHRKTVDLEVVVDLLANIEQVVRTVEGFFETCGPQLKHVEWIKVE